MIDLSVLIGKEFKHNSPTTGISDWIDEVESIFTIHSLIHNKELSKIIGFTPAINIRGKKNGHIYPLNTCIIINCDLPWL